MSKAKETNYKNIALAVAAAVIVPGGFILLGAYAYSKYKKKQKEEQEKQEKNND